MTRDAESGQADLDDALAAAAAYIGREATARETVTEAAVDRFTAAFAPHLDGGQADAAPLGLHWCLAPEAAPADELGPDGHVRKGRFLPPIPLPRRMWAGGEIAFDGPIRAGETVERRSTIRDVTSKRGRSGPLVFVTVDHAYTADGRPAIRERQDIVYRDATPPPAAGEAPARPDPDAPADPAWVREVTTDEIRLFRYSALTFNSHRIHYDRPYATGTEGYPGLVVHGPLQATLLMNAAARAHGAVPASFRYRGRNPMIAGEGCVVCVAAPSGGTRGCWSPDDDARECWTRDGAGRVCMTATAAW